MDSIRAVSGQVYLGIRAKKCIRGKCFLSPSWQTMKSLSRQKVVSGQIYPDRNCSRASRYAWQDTLFPGYISPETQLSTWIDLCVRIQLSAWIDIQAISGHPGRKTYPGSGYVSWSGYSPPVSGSLINDTIPKRCNDIKSMVRISACGAQLHATRGL